MQKSIVSYHFDRINIPEVCKFTYCEVCRRLRPPRCEHCTNCNACILRLDHHCFFVCIGFNNQKFFILYCLYYTMACMSIAGLLSFVMVTQDVDFMAESMYKVAALILSIAISMGIGLLLIIQLRLLFMNQTSYEIRVDNKRKPFKKNSCAQNIEIVFGPRRWLWLSPLHHPHTDTARRSSQMDFIQCVVPTLKSPF